MATIHNSEQLAIRTVGVGLRHYRNNCFFNATLQALFHVPSVIDCMLQSHCDQDECVTCSLRITFLDTRQWSRSIFPSNLYNVLKTKLKNVLNGEQQDAHNFFLALLDTSNEIQHHPLIPDLFSSSVLSVVTCKRCANVCCTSTQYTSIPVDILHISNISDAFRMFFEEEEVEKICTECKTSVTAVKQFKFVHVPQVLCLQIKRFSPDGSKKNTCVEISNHIKISMQMQQRLCCEKKYQLKAVVCHSGTLNSGHYTAIVCENENFFEFDDALVKQIFPGNAIRSSAAYLLFYELQNPETTAGDKDHSNAICNNYMASGDSKWKRKSVEDEEINFFHDDIGMDITTEASDNLTAVSNNYIANENLEEEHEGFEMIESEIKTSEDATSAERTNYIANESVRGDDWQEVQVTDFDGDQDELQWLTEIIADDSEDGDTSEDIIENENQSGRRIADVHFLFDQLQKCTDIVCKRCRKGKMSLFKESRKGLSSTFSFSCSDCGSIKKLLSEQRKNTSQSNVNEAASLGIVSVGLGFYHLEEFCTILNIPCMCYKTYHKHDTKLQTQWWNLAKKMEEDALNEEIRLAKQLNEIDSSGNALLAVKADGSWHTRSYGTNYTSLAGCAAIIGVRTNKIVYMDVKSKYCHVCKMAQANCTPANIHECNANYEGPSSGMENEIIVEGFKYCERKGARFNKFIGDGDSNTYKSLRDLRLYKNPIVYIDKFDCLNHVDKNFGKKYIDLSESKNAKKAGGNLLTKRIGENIRKGVRMAAKHWSKTALTEEEKCANLEKDCMNAPLHCFGIHDNCANYFCSKPTTQQARDNLSQLKSHGLYLPLLNLCQYYFANKVKSWLAGYENNVAEGFNSIIAKYTGGKRVFNALACSYKGRVALAAVQYNSGGHSTTTFQKFVYNNPQSGCLKLEKSRKRKNLGNAIRNEQKPKKRKNDQSRGNKKKRRAYGEGHEDLDFTPSQLEIAKTNFLLTLDEDRRNRDAIQIQTKGQRYNSRWYEIRQNLLTSSYFGRILNARNRYSYTKIVEDILYHNEQHSNTAEQVHQRSHQKYALKVFCDNFENESIDTCGIFIDGEHSFLGASPFRLCGQDGIIMAQCPLKLYGQNILDSIHKKLIPFWKVNGSDMIVNTNSQWYKQIQGQLHICNKTFAYLVVYLSETEFKIEKVLRDDHFWDQEMKEKLIYFFNEAMVKELVNPRGERCMELRKYDEISQTFI